MKKIYKISSIIILILLVISIFIFGKKKDNPKTNNEKTTITVSFYPLYIHMLNISENIPDIEINLLTPANIGCLHDYQLSTKDMKKIQDCDILILNGLGMENFLEKAISTKGENIIIASEDFPAIENNPHIWVSPMGAAYQVEKITKELSVLDSKHENEYNKNAMNYLTKIYNLNNKMHQELDTYSGSKIVTFHEAFPYFAKEFNFDIVSVVERESGTVPSAKELNELILNLNELSKNNNKISLFAEPEYSSSTAEIITRETKLPINILNPCVTGELSKDSYLKTMEENLSNLKNAFSR